MSLHHPRQAVGKPGIGFGSQRAQFRLNVGRHVKFINKCKQRLAGQCATARQALERLVWLRIPGATQDGLHCLRQHFRMGAQIVQ
jgi:hypothetical protein